MGGSVTVIRWRLKPLHGAKYLMRWELWDNGKSMVMQDF